MLRPPSFPSHLEGMIRPAEQILDLRLRNGCAPVAHGAFLIASNTCLAGGGKGMPDRLGNRLCIASVDQKDGGELHSAQSAKASLGYVGSPIHDRCPSVQPQPT